MSTEARRIVLINAGTSDPSSTAMLARRLLNALELHAREQQREVSIAQIDLRPLANEIATALTTGILGSGLQRAATDLREADAVIAATPVYHAGPSGLFSSFFQVMESDILIATPTALLATAGTDRHALVLDEQVRAHFAYLRALVIPTSIFATADDWNAPELGGRIERAAFELLTLVSSDFRTQVRQENWRHYQHAFPTDQSDEVAIDLNSDLMRLAIGGSA